MMPEMRKQTSDEMHRNIYNSLSASRLFTYRYIILLNVHVTFDILEPIVQSYNRTVDINSCQSAVLTNSVYTFVL